MSHRQTQPVSIEHLLVEFKAAHASADWSRIAELNVLTRDCVQQAMQVESDDALRALRPQLQELSALYQQMESQCIEQRDAVAGQLTDLSQGRNGVGHYAATSSL